MKARAQLCRSDSPQQQRAAARSRSLSEDGNVWWKAQSPQTLRAMDGLMDVKWCVLFGGCLNGPRRFCFDWPRRFCFKDRHFWRSGKYSDCYIRKRSTIWFLNIKNSVSQGTHLYVRLWRRRREEDSLACSLIERFLNILGYVNTSEKSCQIIVSWYLSLKRSIEQTGPLKRSPEISETMNVSLM